MIRIMEKIHGRRKRKNKKKKNKKKKRRRRRDMCDKILSHEREHERNMEREKGEISSSPLHTHVCIHSDNMQS